MDLRFLIVLLLSAGLFADAPALAGDAGAWEAPAPPVKTGKERLSDKASDEQRVDDCKVPPGRRGAGLRPTACGRQDQPAEPGIGDTPAPE